MNDKSQYDVISHLTDIPMLGKQYVPGLWKQFEGGSGQMESPMDQSNVTPSTSTQPKEERKENTRAQITGFCRPVDKRACDEADSAPMAKISRRY